MSERGMPAGRPYSVIPPAGDIGATQAIPADLPRATILYGTPGVGVAGPAANSALTHPLRHFRATYRHLLGHALWAT